MKFFDKFRLTNVCKKIGELNNPVYTVVPIAICKGICRPIATMKDKKQDPESKKYAALREGLTEFIAIPSYIFMSRLTGKLAPAFSPEGKSINKILHSSKTTVGFFGVCIAALVVIPGLCSLAMPYALKLFGKDQKDIKQKPFDTETLAKVKDLPKDSPYNQIYSTYPKTYTTTSGGMKI